MFRSGTRRTKPAQFFGSLAEIAHGGPYLSEETFWLSEVNTRFMSVVTCHTSEHGWTVPEVP